MFRMFVFLVAIVMMALSSFVNPASASQVVFRLDDIQDFYLYKAQEEVMDVFVYNKNGPQALSIGVIGDYFKDDTAHIYYVQYVMDILGDKGEVACHSWSHKRLDEMSLYEQELDLDQCRSKLEELFPEKDIVTLIPPENQFNDNTLEAMSFNDYFILSGQCTLTNCKRQPDFGYLPISEPVGVTLSDWTGVGTVREAQDIFEDIQSEIGKQGWAAVMMHPQEFDDSSSLARLEELIDLCNIAGYDLVTFTQLFESHF
ncbi:polysaccharide deacetylase family protein [Moorena sp. SIO3B2]|uniref:polysaccharide deacetylase family protein n=1 Tax=Moorena sp. SIO3B2 TaxID=2607827 RepID=UPI0013C8C1AF|nr:polysaccharide deacetylase family protein [Moorena sp. SIO3B2]NEP36145.1 polysaccharide deacetylase family protein [Moorena sp. SIO3B2]